MTAQFKMIDVPANAIWVDTGLSVTSDQTVVIYASGAVHMYQPKDESAMPWVGPDGGSSRAECGFDSSIELWPLVVNDDTGRDHPAMLVAAVGDHDNRANRFVVGKYCEFTDRTGSLHLCVNDYDMDNDLYPRYRLFDDNRGSFSALIYVDPPEECPQTGDGCEVNCHEPTSPNPIRLRMADKIHTETDLILQTPAGSLSFSRSYIQSKQSDSEFQFMGLGWTHNHAMKLTLSGSSPDRVAIVRLPDGGILTLDEDTAEHFVARAGSSAVMDNDAVTGTYVLTFSDKSQYVFDDTTLRLERRHWPAGDKWLYAYDGGGKLTTVVDEYGNELVFAYYSGLTGDDAYKNDQLWRIGDQDTSGLDNSNPDGRYVELDYIPEKSDGQRVTEAKPLLATVRDVRGYERTYDYYGQHAGEDDGHFLNFLTERQSPEVDTDGDHTPDSSILVEELTYVDTLDLALDGGMEMADDDPDNPWQAVGDNVSHYRSGIDYYEEPYSHFVEAPEGQGIEGNPWKMVGGRTYVISAWVRKGYDTIRMQITDENSQIRYADTIAGSEWQELQIVYTPAADAEDLKQVQFIVSYAEDPKSEFFVDEVSILEVNPNVSQIVQRRGNGLLETEFVFQPEGENITTEMVAGRTTIHHFAGGVYAGAENHLGDFPRQAILDDYRAWGKMDANGTPTNLEWGANGKHLNEVTDALGQQTQFTYDDDDRLQTSIDAQWRDTHYVYDANCRQPTMVVAGVSATQVSINGGMETDEGWLDIGSPQTNLQASTQVDSGDYSRHVAADTVGEGIQSPGWDLEADQTYRIRARVYAVKGTVKMQVPGVAAFDVETDHTAVWETLTAEYTPSSALSARYLQFVASDLDNGAAEFYVDTVSITTTREIEINGRMELETGWTSVGTPSTNTRSAEKVDSGAYSRHVAASVDDGIQSDAWNLIVGQQYTIRARVYPVQGVGGETVLMRLVDGSAQEIANTADVSQGSNDWETLSCRYTPGTDINNVRLQFLADGSSAEFYVDTVSVTLADTLPLHGDMEEDAFWSAIPNNEPQINERSLRVDSGTYFCHVAEVSQTGDGIESDIEDWTLTQNHTYLVMARVYAVKGAVRIQVPDVAAFDAETEHTGAWETLRVVYEHSGSTTNKSLQFVASELDAGSNDAEFYVDTVHLLDLGILSGDRKDQLRWQEFAYDTKGRVLAERTINPENASLVQEITRSYRTFEPGSGLLHQVIQKDMDGADDTTTTYTYDSVGRVVQTQQLHTFGGCELSYTVHDAAGNVLASVCNYDPGTHAPPTSAEEAAVLYDASVPDKNQVTTYRYDEMGRRVEVTTNAGTDHAITTLTLYDALSRVIRTISHYKPPQGANPPGEWEWNAQPRQWEDGSQLVISHGTDNTENIVADTAYNQRGQVRLQRDVLGHVILYGYDDAGRQVKVVRNAATPDYNNDYAGSTPNQADPGLTTYERVDAPDQDLVTSSEYDAAGNLIRSLDPLDNASLMIYDALNRLVKTVRSASDPDYDIRHDPTLANYIFSDDPDLDLVEETVYETMGRVLYTQDVFGRRTWSAYDNLDRQVKTIVNAQGAVTYGGTRDPRSDDYDASSDTDKDLISRTHYNDQGRVQWTLDPIGRRTWYVYDGLGRQIRTVVNCTYDPDDPQGVPPEDPAYTSSSDSDKDLISHTFYDTDGRVSRTTDARGNETRYAYDVLGRRILVVQNFYDDGIIDTDLSQWEWNAQVGQDGQWEDGSSSAIPHGDDLDRNVIAWTGYDLAGRVSVTRDTPGRETRHEYDILGRRTRIIVNYVDGTFDPDYPDEDLISQTEYNVAGQVTATVDARGTTTAFEYDDAGRQVVVTQAAGTSLATRTYTCYDKTGRVLRMITNWVEPEGENPPSPDDRDETDWVFAPDTHGRFNDENLITEYELNHLDRRVRVIDPVGNETLTAYDKAGRMVSANDAEDVETVYRYDDLGRMIRVVQNYQSVEAPLQIAFVSNRDGNNQIYVMNADGTCQTRLAAYDSDDYGPAWSPDGRKLAFVSDRDEVPGIYVIEVDDPTPRRLVEIGDTVDSLNWSPDGNQLLFCFSWANKHSICVIRSDGSSGLKRLTDDTSNNYDPEWSPDGSTIVFMSTRDGNPEIYVMNADGSNQVRLTESANGGATEPHWSPDGSRIAFVSSSGGNSEIFVMNADGSEPTQLTDHQLCHSPAWSPDGSRIVFSTAYDIYVIDDENIVNIAYEYGAVNLPRWSPYSDKIVFMSDKDGNDELYVVDDDGENPIRLTNNNASDIFPAWSPVRRTVNPVAYSWNQNATPPRWEDGWGQVIDHHSPVHDRNVIASVEYDKAGRRTVLTDPRHNETSYSYDQLNRRTALTDPLDHTWQTGYEDVDGGSRVTLTDPETHDTRREFDRLGRLKTIDYLGESPKVTPDVTFTYDPAGNRATMVEDNGVSNVRAAEYTYDDARRLNQVDFDIDGDDDIDETVRYEYDAGGLRTRLTLPGDLSVTYTYDAKGRLVSLTDWDDHTTSFTYDDANRLAVAERANGLRSRYSYDAAGHLRLLRHKDGPRTLGHFAYEVDGRGNRTQALEVLAPPAGGGTVYAYDDESITYHGSWDDDDPYQVSTSFSAALTLMFFGDTATLTVGTGPDHGLFDVYINESLWRSFDGYAASSGEKTIDIPLASMGPHTIEIRHGHEKNLVSTGYTLRFRQLVTSNAAYIRYTYDALSRLQEARYNPAFDLDAPDEDLLRRYQYSYDLAGNRTQVIETVAGTPATSNYTYNEANQIDNQGFGYDTNGNLTNDGTNSYVWDRANRLLSMGGHSHAYDGLGNRVSQTVSSIVTRYLLDVQPGLVKVLSETTSGNSTRYVHVPRGIHAQEDPNGDWTWMVQDALGSVRSVIDNALVVDSVQNYAPYGEPLEPGSFGSPFKFTGEMMDANDLVYLRARHYHPELGVFLSLDPVENLNRYQYVSANPVNLTDPAGLQAGEGTLVAGCLGLASADAMLPFGDALCIGILIAALAAGVIDWNDISEASEDLAQRISDVLQGVSTSDIFNAEALPETGTPPWMPTVVITPIPLPVAPTASPGPMQDNDPRSTQPPPVPVPLPTPNNPTSCPTATPTRTPTPRPGDYEFVGYHGTSSNSAPSILNNIFARGRGQLGTGFYVYPVEPKPTLQMSNSNEAAYDQAIAAARIAAAPQGGDPSALCIFARNYSNMIWRYVPAENPESPGEYLWWHIPYSFYLDYDYLVSEVDDAPGIWQVKFNPRAVGELSAEECNERPN